MDQAPPQPQSNAPAGREYRLAPDARRTVVALFAGVLAVAVYALWTLVTLAAGGLQGPEWVSATLMLAILALSPAVAWSLLAEYHATIRTDAAGLTFHTLGGVDLAYGWPQVHGVSAAPARLGRFTLGGKARSAGRIAEPQPMDTLSEEGVPVTGNSEEIRPPGPDEDAPDSDSTAPASGALLEVTVDPPALERIANPVVRLLQQWATAGTVPLYPGLADRPALLAEIAAHTGGAPVPAGVAAPG